MSRRTSESNKAIAQAWEREKQRVSEATRLRGLPGAFEVCSLGGKAGCNTVSGETQREK